MRVPTDATVLRTLKHDADGSSKQRFLRTWQPEHARGNWRYSLEIPVARRPPVP